MKVLKKKGLKEVLEACQRPVLSDDQIFPLIDEIFDQVRRRGDEAVQKYTKLFDKSEIGDFRLSPEEISSTSDQVSDDLKSAIDVAKCNIERFHASQQSDPDVIETTEGVYCWQESRAIERIGIYIPGGTAPLFSTVLMLAVPAKIAGCKEVVLCTPPGPDGKIDPAILYAAQITGVSSVYRVGGAQAIAALTFGTETIPSVYKIFGPGNQYVTCAKQRALQFGVSIDMPAGPSELMVVADDSCEINFVASDLLSQAEHGVDSQVICLLLEESLENELIEAIDDQLSNLSRKEIAEKALKNSLCIVENDPQKVIQIINEYGPEHLILATNVNKDLIPAIQNAGSVFLGNYTPESAGDYASGTNHTLPTSGFSKAYSGVNLDAFVKKITFQEISSVGIQKLGPTIEVLAEAEQLDAHKNAVTIRLKTLNNGN